MTGFKITGPGEYQLESGDKAKVREVRNGTAIGWYAGVTPMTWFVLNGRCCGMNRDCNIRGPWPWPEQKEKRVDLGWYRILDGLLEYAGEYQPRESRFPCRSLTFNDERIIDVTDDVPDAEEEKYHMDVKWGRRHIGSSVLGEHSQEKLMEKIDLARERLKTGLMMGCGAEEISEILREIAARLP